MERPASECEIAEMREIVRRGIRAGAVGFATSKSPTHVGYSGKPVPSRKAEMSEITALASVLAEENSGVIQATVGRELFLKEFAEDTPWLHLDIAGTAWMEEQKAWIAKGPSGIAVRSLVEFVKQLGESS